MNDNFRETLISILMRDVLASHDRLAANDCQTARREFIRTVFAAIEGVSWAYKEDVWQAARDVLRPSEALEAAFSDIAYRVGDDGRIAEQPHIVSVTTTIRLATRVAMKMKPGLTPDFAGNGWNALKQTVKLRNRITHPKSVVELSVSDGEIQASWTAILWLGRLVSDAMQATLEVRTDFLAELRQLSRELVDGQPEAIAAYRTALLLGDD